MGNPKDSEWRVTPNARRHRKRFEVTLSEEEQEKLMVLARQIAPGNPERARSSVIARLIMAAKRVP